MLNVVVGTKRFLDQKLREAYALEADFRMRGVLVAVSVFIVCSFCIAVISLIKILVSIPIHVRYSPQEGFQKLARRGPNGEFLDSYSEHVREQKRAVLSVVIMLVAAGLQLSILGFGLFVAGKPSVTQAAGANFIAFWDGAGSPPAGWSCISCSPGDDFYQLFPRGNTTYGGTGGVTTNTHAMSLVSTVENTDGSATFTKSGGAAFDSPPHNMTAISGATVGSASIIPPYRDLKVIEYTTGGNPPTIPTGVIVMFDAVPTGSWSRYASQDNNYMYGANDATGTGGSATASYTFSGTLTTPTVAAGLTGSAGSSISSSHTHAFSGMTAPTDIQPLRVDVLLYQATSNVLTPAGIVGMWNGTPPTGWSTVSGDGQTYYLRYLRGASAYAASGGAATSTPDNVTVTSDPPSGTTASTNSGTPKVTIDDDHAHTHDVTVSFNSASNNPPYRDVIIAQKGTVTVSGTLYNDENTTKFDCTGANNRTIQLRVNGTGTYSGTCTDSIGSYSIPNVSLNAGDVVTVWVAGGLTHAATVTRATDGGITGLDLYRNAVIVRNDDAGPITNANISAIDSVTDEDIPFTVSSGTLTVTSGSELYVWPGSNFTPGGSVLTSATGSQSALAGDVHVPATATLAMETNALSVGGDLNNAGLFTLSAGQVTTFTATGSGFQITPGGTSFANVVANGTNGTWNAQTALVVSENLTVTHGTFALGAHALTVGSTGVTNSGNVMVASGQSLTQSSGSTTTILSSASGANCIGSNGTLCAGTAGTISIGGLTIGDAATTIATTLGATAPTMTMANALIITTHATFTADGSSLNVGGSFTNNGAFTHTNGTLTITGTGTITSGTATLNNVAMTGSGTVTLANATHTIAGNLTISKTFSAGTSTVLMTGTGATITTNSTKSFYRLTIAGTVSTSGSISVSNAATINSGKTLTLGGSLQITSSSSLVASSATIGGTGNIIFQKTTGFPTNATINANVFFQPNSGSVTIPAEPVPYGGNIGCSSILSTVNCDISSGTVINGSLSVSAQSADAGLSGTNITVGGNIVASNDGGTASLVMGGDWVVHGDLDLSSFSTFSPGTSLTMDGNNATNTATLTGAGDSFNDLILQPVSNKTVVLSSGIYYVYGNVVLGGAGSLTTTGTTIRTNSTGKSLTSNGKSIESLVLNSGNFALADAATLSGDLTVGTATLTAPSTTLTIAGNFSNIGTFNANGGTVAFNGASASTVTGTTTFNNVSVTTPGKTLKFGAGTVTTVLGNLTLTGTSGSKVTLSSDTPASKWLAHFALPQSSISNTIIKDSGCDAGTANVTLTSTSLNAGNNSSCWQFSAPALSVNDSLSADAPYTSSDTTLSANWSIADATNVDHYEYAIGSTAGGTDIVPFTSTLLVTNMTHGGLTLTNGTTYYTTVRAQNIFNFPIASATSNGITVNTGLPTIADNQTGDISPRKVAGTTYDVDFTKASAGPQLDYAQYAVYSGPNKTGNLVKDWTDIFTTDTDSYVTNWTVDFPSLVEGINYISVRVVALDALSNELDDAFTILKDTVPPAVNVLSASPSTTSAVITWTTNEPASTQVEYGLTTSYGIMVTLNAALTTSHTVALSGLTPNTTFHVRALSVDEAGNSTTSADLPFTTQPTPMTVITNVTVSEITSTSVEVTWTTNEPATSKVRYGTTTSYGLEVSDLTLVTSHVMTISGLTTNTAYHYEVISTGSTTDNDADATFTTQSPTQSTTVANVQVVMGEKTATVTWTTNEPATSKVRYGTTTSYGSFVSSPIKTIHHSVTLPDLLAGTTYHFVVVSTGSSTAITLDDSFATTSKVSMTNRAISPTLFAPSLTDGSLPVITFSAVAKGHQTVRIYLDGKVIQTIRTQGPASETVAFYFRISTTSLRTGRHTIYAQSTDASGRTSVVRQRINFSTGVNTLKPTVQLNTGSTYIVHPGDSLWSISKQFLGDPLRYGEIVRLNLNAFPSLLAEPEKIQPGWELRLPATR